MTIAALSKCLGIPRRTLYRYRKDYPDQAPKSFDELDSWIEFIGRIRNYPADRTRPRDRNGNETSAEDHNGEYSPALERKERILKLRLGNEVRRTSLEKLRESVVSVAECEATMDRIRAVVSGEILKLPGSLCHELAGKDAAFIQGILARSIYKCLESSSRPEIFFKTKTEQGANGLDAVSGG
jgi:hypothetical protein